jgi:spermidine/putrescine-binding protein
MKQTMKAIIMAVTALALFAGISTAEAAPKTVYTVTMTGVT